MPPEYMMNGAVSTKTDIFSFGVLLLEIVSSKMNHGSYDVEHPLNLPGFVNCKYNFYPGVISFIYVINL